MIRTFCERKERVVEGRRGSVVDGGSEHGCEERTWSVVCGKMGRSDITVT